MSRKAKEEVRAQADHEVEQGKQALAKTIRGRMDQLGVTMYDLRVAMGSGGSKGKLGSQVVRQVLDASGAYTIDTLLRAAHELRLRVDLKIKERKPGPVTHTREIVLPSLLDEHENQ